MALKRRTIVVGLGSIGRRHARLLQARGDIDVQFCEPQAAMLDMAFAEIGRRTVFPTFAEALASQPEIMVIATPHNLHAEQTVAALGRGIHVLCEKPMSDTLASARAMRDAAASSKAILCIGFMLQFHPAMQRMKAILKSGELGQVLALRYLVGSYVTLVNSRSRFQAELEGALLMDYAHQPDILHWLLERRPAGVYMAGSRGGDIPLQSNPNFLALVCDYAPAPLLATIDLNYVQMPQRHEFELMGDKAWALCDMQRGRIRIGTRATDTEREEDVPFERDGLYTAEHQAFLDALDGKRPPFRSGDDGLVSMEVITAALKSWRSGARVPL